MDWRRFAMRIGVSLEPKQLGLILVVRPGCPYLFFGPG